jgi:hypothetical protein
MAPIERYVVHTHIQLLDNLYTIYDIIQNNQNIDSIEFEKGATIGYIKCSVSGEGIRGYEKAYSLLKKIKTYCHPFDVGVLITAWREPDIRLFVGNSS